MNRLLAVATTVAVCWLGTTQAAWAGPLHLRGDDVFDAAQLQAADFRTFWSSDLRLPADDRVTDVDLLDENLYLRTKQGLVYVVHADTGILRWAQPLDGRDAGSRRPVHLATSRGPGPVFFVTDSAVLRFDRASGRSHGRIDLPFPAGGGGGVADDCGLYVSSTLGRVHGLSWCADAAGSPVSLWHVEVGGFGEHRLALRSDGRLFFSSSDGTVYCTSARGNRLLWRFPVPASIVAGPVLDDSGVYVPASDHMLYVLAPDTGELLHVHQLPAPMTAAPVVTQRTVYQSTARFGMHAFDTDTRKPLWHAPQARRFVARGGNLLILSHGAGRIILADNDSGTIRHRINLPSDVLLPQNLSDAVVYAVTPAGRIQCVKPASLPYQRRDSREADLSPDSPPEPSANSAVSDGSKGSRSDPFRSTRP